MQRRHTMKSFTWEPSDGDEISSCPDCAHWHAMFVIEDLPEDLGPGIAGIVVREWHEPECQIWIEAKT